MPADDRVEPELRERPEGSVIDTGKWSNVQTMIAEAVKTGYHAGVRETSEHTPPRPRTGHRQQTIAYTLGGTPTRLWVTLITTAAVLFATGYTWVRAETDAAREEARAQCQQECDFSKGLLVECLQGNVEGE